MIHFLANSQCVLLKIQIKCCCLVTKSCLFCDPMDCNPSGSSVHVISQARIQESGLPFHSPVEASWPRDWTCNFSIGRQILYHWAMRETLKQMISSVQFTRSVVSDSLWPHGLQHTRLPCPSPTPGAISIPYVAVFLACKASSDARNATTIHVMLWEYHCLDIWPFYLLVFCYSAFFV